MAPSTASVPLLMKKRVLEVARRDLAEQLRERAAQRVEQLLRGERHALELSMHRLDDLGVADARGVDAVAAQAVDEPAARDVVEVEPWPLHSRAANSPPSVTDLRYSR